jgi:hypothetical protein
MDWHHRRNSMAMYWRQQKGYGKAEALLEEKWPERYNAFGHLNWSGRLYGRGFAFPIPFGRARVYGGVWGTAAYQSLYEAGPAHLAHASVDARVASLIAALAALTLLGLLVAAAARRGAFAAFGGCGAGRAGSARPHPGPFPPFRRSPRWKS